MDAADPPSDDLALVGRARGGDRDAFALLYERHAPAVHGILLSCAPRAEVGDLLQDVFLLALRSIECLQDASSFGPWLLTIARNRARDLLRARRPTIELEEGMDPSMNARLRVDEEQEAEAALEAVRSLPEAYRETLVLRLVEGLSGPEIAARTGMTHGSVRVNLCRGMKLLRERLGTGEGT